MKIGFFAASIEFAIGLNFKCLGIDFQNGIAPEVPEDNHLPVARFTTHFKQRPDRHVTNPLKGVSSLVALKIPHLHINY